TYKSIFPQVYIIPVRSNTNEVTLQNVMIIALKSDQIPKWVSNNGELNGYLSKVWRKEPDTGLPILTDDFAPVDYYKMLAL
nr:spermidine synthase [Candidatus Magasanikbacteria bacterium]